MSYLVVCTTALLASSLTFFSGFGLGTLLLPAFALFLPIDHAVALTAVVHFLNGLFKLALVGRHADRSVILRFGVPAVLASLIGAWTLHSLSGMPIAYSYAAFGREFEVAPVKFVVGALLILFAAVEAIPILRDMSFGPRYLPLGGLLSGFFGGLAGMQGALRSAFLSRAGLSKEAFIGTGSVIACLIDVTRLGVYATALANVETAIDVRLLTAAAVAAFVGALVGNRFLKKSTMNGVQRVVALMLFAVGGSLVAGIL